MMINNLANHVETGFQICVKLCLFLTIWWEYIVLIWNMKT